MSGAIKNVTVESVSGTEVIASRAETFDFRSTDLEGSLVATSDVAETEIAVRALPAETIALVPFESAFTVRSTPTPFALFRGATVELVLHAQAADGTRLVDLDSEVRSSMGALAPSKDRWDVYAIPATGNALTLSFSVTSRSLDLSIPVVDHIDSIEVVHGTRIVDPAEFPSVGSAYVCVEGRLNSLPVAGLAWTITSDATYTHQGGPTSLVPDGGCALVDSPTTQLTFSAAGLQRTFAITRK
jgi:hypothetical protein